MNNKQRTNKAFTLIELVVAVALLAMIVAFSGVVFRVSIDSYRTATANAEIMQKLRAITGQLDTDFKAIRPDAPLLIWFEQDDPNRYDQVMFFATGDFASTQLYDYDDIVGFEIPADTGEPVRGNVARIFYGQAYSLDPTDNTMKYPDELKAEDRILARRQHILTADEELVEWPNVNMSDFSDGSTFEDKDKYNECYEHDSLSLAQWKTIDGDAYRDKIIPTCFASRPLIDMDDPNTFHKLMCEGVGSFTIQWAYWDDDFDDKTFRWYPSDDPAGDNSEPSHFDLIGKDMFGVYFNIPGTATITDWEPVGNIEYDTGDKFPSDFYPAALKFTFRLYDSKGVIKEGREFTHIVYLRN